MPDTTRPAIVSLSGGMDSATLLAHYADQGHPLIAISVDYGQRHVRELVSARDIAAHYGVEHIVLDLRSLGAQLKGSALTDPDIDVPKGHYAWSTMKITVVPNRNSLIADNLLSIAISRGASVLAMGMHAGDHTVYRDCRPEWVDKFNTLARTANEDPPPLEAPFVHISKTDIARLGDKLNVPYEMTWSCYQGDDKHCGVCGTCYERREAFRDAGITDPTEYLDSTTVFAETR